jgi:hypothetical protein
MQTVDTLITVSEQYAITCLVCEYPEKPISFYTIRLPELIKNITPKHYLYLGLVIGQISATEKTLEEFTQNNNPLSKCRAN